MWAYTDGSVKNKSAAHSFLLICGRDIHSHQITGAGETTGNPSTICSLRPEHSGALAAMLLVAILEHKHSLHNSGYLNLGIDNITVVKRLTKDKIDALDDDSHDPTDYDLWQESISLMSNMTTTVTTMHVKSHQDDILKKEFGGIGPMPRHAHYNIIADKLVENKRKTLQECSYSIVAPSIKAAVSIRGNVITSETTNHIKHELSGVPIIDYLMRRNKWTERTFDSIDWDAHERYLKKLPYLKAIKVVKYIHDWQNTGDQKKLFDSKREEPHHKESEYLCPLKCGCPESAQHFLRCEKVNSSAEMARVLKDLNKWFLSANTNQALTTTLMHCIREWLQFGHSQPNLDFLNIANEPNSTELHHAIAAQSDIGWDQFFKGRIATNWGTIQQRHYDVARSQPKSNLKKYHDKEWWTANVIKQVVYIALNAWQIRNDKLHENKKRDDYNVERERLHALVQTWYDREGEFGDGDHRRHFNKSYLDRKNSTNTALQQWTRAISSTYTYMKKQDTYIHQAKITNFLAH